MAKAQLTKPVPPANKQTAVAAQGQGVSASADHSDRRQKRYRYTYRLILLFTVVACAQLAIVIGTPTVKHWPVLVTALIWMKLETKQLYRPKKPVLSYMTTSVGENHKNHKNVLTILCNFTGKFTD